MTTVIGILGEDTVSADILEMDIWFELLTVGRWQLILKNIANKWGDDFQPNNVVDLKIDDTTMLKGYIDDVLPYLDDKGVYKNLIKIVGRDNARDLARLYCTAGYVDTEIDDIIRDLFLKTDSEISGPALTTTPVATISRRRTYLIDWIKDVALRPSPNYEAYVDQAKTLQLFQVGDGDYHSDVDLTSIAGALDNNILDLEKGEAVGFSIANCIELSAGSLKDHWTDGNPADFTPAGGDTLVTYDADMKIIGISSIKFYCTENCLPSATLDFSSGLYSHAALDMSDPAEMSFFVRHTGIPTFFSIRPLLEDGDGNIIEFKRMGNLIGVTQKGRTEFQIHNNWVKLQIPYGESENQIIKEAETNNSWYYAPLGHITTFDWSNIKKITFKCFVATQGAASVWIDNLCIPTVEVISIAEDAVSQAAYGKAMYFDRRSDIRSQIELDVISGHTGGRGELAKRKDPLKKIRVTAIGQIGSRYAGKSLDVQAPGHGITELTKYRIVKIHHRVTKNPIKKGFNFITVYDLVKHTLSPGTQVIDPIRFGLASDPRGALIEALNITRRRVRTAEGTERAEFGDTHPVSKVFFSEHGAAFLSDPDDGCQFWLTADYHDGTNQYYGAPEGIGYQYDAVAGIWKRAPSQFRRYQDPPSGGEVEGDILVRIDLDPVKTFQWTGTEWMFIGTPDLAGMEGDLDDITDGEIYNKILAEYVDTGKALVKALNQIQDELITIGKIQDWTIGTTAPPSPDQGHIWLDTNVSPPQMKRWDGSNWIRLDVITLIDMGGDLDDIDDGSTYGRILLTAIQAGKILLAEVIGDLSDIDGDIDDIADGTTYGRIKLTSMQAGEILLAEAIGDLDDLLDGSIYGKIKITALQAGLVLIAEAVGDLDDIEDGSTHGKVLVTSISGGKILVGQLDGNIDDMVDGDTYAKMLKNWRASDVTYIDGGKLYAGTWIESKKFRTDESPNPRVEFDSTGIYGYSDATTKQFYLLAADGKAYAGGGAVILDSWGVTIKGEALRFKGTTNLRGIIFGHEGDHELNITAYEDMRITVLGSGAPLGDLTLNAQGSVRPPINAARDLGKPGYTWRFYVPITTLASRPAAHEDYAGLLWITEETTGDKSLLWICMRNDVSTYEWVQLGLTT